jgi:chromosome partitioning protein
MFHEQIETTIIIGEKMSVVVTVMNMKGGVGKTTVSTHLAGLLGRYSVKRKARKILAIDYDPQFNMSQTFLSPKTYFQLEKDRKTTLSILLYQISAIVTR